MDDIASLEAEIAKLQAKVDAKKAYRDSLTPEQAKAEMLHSRVCRWNHTDGCGWEYEDWSRPGHARSQYIERVYKIEDAGITVEDAIKVYELVMGYGS